MFFSKKPENSGQEENDVQENIELQPSGQDSGLVDVFEDEDISDTRRVRLEDLKDKESGDSSAKPDEDDEFDIEERDYRPIRQRRDGKLGCLGGLMFAVFVISLSVILACAAWMAAGDVLALNKDPLSATITIPKSAFSEKEVDIKDEEERSPEPKRSRRRI